MSNIFDPVQLPPSTPDDSVGTVGAVTPVDCPTSFFECLDLIVRNQSNKILNLQTALLGVQCCVYNPVIKVSEYDLESQSFYYSDTPDFEGKLMIKGLAQYTRFSGRDTYTGDVELYWDQPADFEIHEDAKIIVHVADKRLAFKAKFLKRQMGQFYELRRVYTLVPFL